MNRWKYNSDLPSLYIFIFWDNSPDYPSQGTSCFAGLHFLVGFRWSDSLCGLVLFPQLTLPELNVCTCVCRVLEEGTGRRDPSGMKGCCARCWCLPPGARGGGVSAGGAAEGAAGQGMARLLPLPGPAASISI